LFFPFFCKILISINPEISPNVYKTMEKSATSELGALQSAQIVWVLKILQYEPIHAKISLNAFDTTENDPRQLCRLNNAREA